MLGFLRRIRKSLLEEGHLKKYATYAVGEILLVMIGILLALQVNNWNETRKEQARAESYLLRILQDLESDDQVIKDRIDFWSQVESYGTSAIRHAESEILENDSSWDTVLAYYQASQLWPYYTNNSAYEELVSAGELSLIRNVELREALTYYYKLGAASQADYIFRLVPEYRERIRGLVPWNVQQYIWENCYKQEDTRQQLIACPSPISDVDAREILITFESSEDLIKHLRYWIANLVVARKIFIINREEVQRLARQVMQEIHK